MGTVVGLAEWPDVDFVGWSTGDLVDALERLNCQAASERTLLGAAVAAEHLSRRLDAMRGQALERAAHMAGEELANPSGLVNAAVEGIDSAAAEVALALALHRREAITLVGEAVSVVQDLPLLWQLVRQGRLAWKIAVVTHDRMSACLSPGTAKWRAVQAVLAEKLPGRTWDSARRLTSREIHTIDPEAAHRRYLTEQKDLYVRAFPLDDGMGGLSVKMRADHICLINATLDALADAQRDAARRAGTPDQRTHQQRRADMLLGLVLKNGSGNSLGLPTQQGRPLQVTLFATLDSVLGLTEEQGELQGHGPVPAEQVRDIIREGAKITLQIVGEDGHGPGDQANCAETAQRYKPRQTVVDQVLSRFPQCVHPGCTHPAARCDVDHAIPFAKGGRSCPCNLVPLCRAHHQLKTHGGWSLRLTRPGERHPVGTIEFRSRLGQVHIEPAPDVLGAAGVAPKSAEAEVDAATRTRLRDAAWDSETTAD